MSKSKRGRPTRYRAKYCDDLIEHMASGLSFETFGPTIGVRTSTIYNWLKKHDDFVEAKKEGLEHSRNFYERIGRKAMLGTVKDFNTTLWIFNMKNRFGWRDKIETNVDQKTFVVTKAYDDKDVNK